MIIFKPNQVNESAAFFFLRPELFTGVCCRRGVYWESPWIIRTSLPVLSHPIQSNCASTIKYKNNKIKINLFFARENKKKNHPKHWIEPSDAMKCKWVFRFKVLSLLSRKCCQNDKVLPNKNLAWLLDLQRTLVNLCTLTLFNKKRKRKTDVTQFLTPLAPHRHTFYY